MYIVIHTQYYPPEIGAPQARLSELAIRLTQKGWHVTVLTAMPNYPKGKIYAGYGGLMKIEQRERVKVIRTAIFPTQRTETLPRLLNYFSFVFSSFFIGGWLIKRPQFILTESPPLFLGISGYLLSLWKDAKWIFNVSDLWPETAVRLGVLGPGIALRMSNALEALFYQKAWMVTGQSRSIIANINHRFPNVRTFHFSNGVDTVQFNPQRTTIEARNYLGNSNEIIALYAGLHGLAQGLEQILLAAQQLQSEQHLKFVFIGDGPEKQKLVELSKTLNLNNVHFLEPVAKEMMPALVAAADLCIIPLKIYIPGAVPSKLYEAMASERPVILIATGEPAEIVTHHRAGIVVKPGEIESLVHELRSLVNDPVQRRFFGSFGRKAAENFFNREKIVDQFANFLENQM